MDEQKQGLLFYYLERNPGSYVEKTVSADVLVNCPVLAQVGISQPSSSLLLCKISTVQKKELHLSHSTLQPYVCSSKLACSSVNCGCSAKLLQTYLACKKKSEKEERRDFILF